jgi:hypothetical protein
MRADLEGKMMDAGLSPEERGKRRRGLKMTVCWERSDRIVRIAEVMGLSRLFVEEFD